MKNLFPPYDEMELALLEALISLGGTAGPQDVYPRMDAAFPNLSEEARNATLLRGDNKWQNRIRWTPQRLFNAGFLHPIERGQWQITPAGRARLQQASIPANHHAATRSER